ncbi:MAG: inosine/xanthosine triphosphatase [Candidatus Woesearchaeota archaeon]
MKVLVGSENPVKIDAVREAFSKYFEDVETIALKVDSDVADQPLNDDTFIGAKNRALHLRRIDNEKILGADFFIGIEGGIIQLNSTWFVLGAMCIIDKDGNIGFGTTSLFQLPDQIIDEILQGKELGDVIDRITGEQNSKQKNGAVGYFTKDVVSRKSYYVNGIIKALIPFLNKEHFFNK